MTAAILATALATPPVALAAWLTFRFLTAAPGAGRHRLDPTADQYRPRPMAAMGPVVIPGPPDPGATGVVDVRDMAVPVPMQRALTPEMRALAGAIEKTRTAIPDDVAAGLGGVLGERTRELVEIQ
jgi:hypothetical protein